jgi:ferrochelatase
MLQDTDGAVTTDETRLAFAPPGHPPVAAGRIGVVLANLGTPDATDYWSMRRYLNEFLSDRRVIDYSPLVWQPLLQLVILTRRPFSSGRNYRGIWNVERNESPLLTITREQAEALGDRMARHGVVVDFAMRYGNPSTPAVLGRLREQGCERIVFFPLYPQYSAPTTATANDQAFRALMRMRWQPAIRTVPAYYDHPLYIEALARSVEAVWAGLERRPDVLVTSYHGMPERYLREGDPYHCQCRATSRRLGERLGLGDELVVTFQSRFGTEEWLKPYTVEEVARLARAGRRRIAVVAPAFSADCVETLEEINGEIRESFMHAGGEEFTYVPCLNAGDDHIEMMAAILERELGGWLP